MKKFQSLGVNILSNKALEKKSQDNQSVEDFNKVFNKEEIVEAKLDNDQNIEIEENVAFNRDVDTEDVEYDYDEANRLEELISDCKIRLANTERERRDAEQNYDIAVSHFDEVERDTSMEHGSEYTDSDYWSALEDKRDWERTLSVLESDVSEIERELYDYEKELDYL